MGVPKESLSKKGTPMHFVVGALIKRGDKYLLIDRAIPPFGFAAIAGHIDKGETPEGALFREVEEEGGLKVKKFYGIFEEELDWSWCSRGIVVHYWYLFDCKVSGKN